MHQSRLRPIYLSLALRFGFFWEWWSWRYRCRAILFADRLILLDWTCQSPKESGDVCRRVIFLMREGDCMSSFSPFQSALFSGRRRRSWQTHSVWNAHKPGTYWSVRKASSTRTSCCRRSAGPECSGPILIFSSSLSSPPRWRWSIFSSIRSLKATKTWFCWCCGAPCKNLAFLSTILLFRGETCWRPRDCCCISGPTRTKYMPNCRFPSLFTLGLSRREANCPFGWSFI